MGTQLDRVYDLEKQKARDVWLVQPTGGGALARITWAEGLDQARRMATHLASLGLPPKSQIAIFSKNTAWWLLADLAIWMAGHVSVPLYPTLTPSTIRQILDHSESRLVFVGKLDGFAAMAPGIPASLPRIAMPLAPPLDAPAWDDIVKKTAPTVGSPRRDPGDLATIVYTSGTTGEPKGVMHSFETMCAVDPLFELLGVSERDRLFSYLPLAHVFERAAIETSTFTRGTEVHFAESLDTFVQDLARARPTFFVSVPRLWLKFQQGVHAKMPPSRLRFLLRLPFVGGLVGKRIRAGLGLDHARFGITGSAPIPPELIAWYRSIGLEILEGYAMSENFAYSHLNPPGKNEVGTVGVENPGVATRISDAGEVLVKSPCTTLGYFKAPALTAEALTEDGFLRTGDRGVIDAAGYLRITGRVKELFKTSKGKYVAPAPIENKLLRSDAIELACVQGAAMPQPHAVVVLSEKARALAETAGGKEQVERSLAAHVDRVNDELDHHERLELLAVETAPWTIEGGMLTPTLKVKRAMVEERYGKRVEGWYEARRPIVWV